MKPQLNITAKNKSIKPSNRLKSVILVLFVSCLFPVYLNAAPFENAYRETAFSNGKPFDDIFDWVENGFKIGKEIREAFANPDIDGATKETIEQTLQILWKERKTNPSRLAYSSGMTDLIRKFAKKPKNRAAADYLKDVKQALAELRQAVFILKKNNLTANTQIVINASMKNGDLIFTKNAGLPAIDVADVEADCYFLDNTGILHLVEVKNTFRALTQKLREEIDANKNRNKIGQFERYGQWVNRAENRNVMVVIRDSDQDFYRLLEEDYIYLLAGCVRGKFAKPFLQIDNRIYSISDLRRMSMDSRKKMAELVEETQETENSLIEQYFNSVEDTFSTLEKEYGSEIK
jgi:hypothetical protein